MIRRNIRRILLLTILCAALVYLIIPVDFLLNEKFGQRTFTPHIDHESASLQTELYHSSLLDNILVNGAFLALPELELLTRQGTTFQWFHGFDDTELMHTITEFARSIKLVSSLWSEVLSDIEIIEEFEGEFRITNAAEQVAGTSFKISKLENRLNWLLQAAKSIDKHKNVSFFPVWIELKSSFDEMMVEFGDMKEALELLQTSLEADYYHSLTFNLEPTTAWVGDNVSFRGKLGSEENPLVNREVDIFINGSLYTTATTDSFGYYRGIVQVPYLYTEKMHFQVLYSPSSEYLERDLPSLSPVRVLDVLFYTIVFNLTVEANAYPGLDTTLVAKINPSESTLINGRVVGIFFDDILINEFVPQEEFRQIIKIDPITEVGRHLVKISAPASGRYSTIDSRIFLNVTKAIPKMDITYPKLETLPGNVSLEGRLYSGFGPLAGASTIITLGESQVEATTTENGTFDAVFKLPMDISVIDSQDLTIQVLPSEPWNAPFNTTYRIIVLNIINSAVIVGIFLLIRIYLWVRSKKRGAFRQNSSILKMPPVRPEQPSQGLYDGEHAPVVLRGEDINPSWSQRVKILYWYQLAVRLLGRITNKLQQPQQTLREFARENTVVLGASAKYFSEFTSVIEKVLYSRYKPTDTDVENSELSVRKTEEYTSHLDTTLPEIPLKGSPRPKWLGWLTGRGRKTSRGRNEQIDGSGELK